jgi:hypothetical protein
MELHHQLVVHLLHTQVVAVEEAQTLQIVLVVVAEVVKAGAWEVAAEIEAAVRVRLIQAVAVVVWAQVTQLLQAAQAVQVL